MALSHSPRIATNGLVLCLDAANTKSYPGTGTLWTDLSGTGNNATLVNAPTLSQGRFNFNGTNQYASIAYTASLAPTTAITFEAFVSLPSWDIATELRVLSKTEGGGYQIGLNEGIIGVGFVGALLWFGGAYRVVKVARNTLAAGWHHLAFTCDGRYFRMYQDSLEVNTYDHGSQAVIAYAVNNSFMIAAEVNNSTDPVGNYWTGSIASVKVYNRALTATEVAQNFDAYRGRFSI